MTKATPTYEARSLYDQPGYARQYDQTRYIDDPAKTQRDDQTRRAIAETLSKLQGVKHILDLPCGTGRLSEQLLQSGYQYTGVDLSPAMLEVAREKMANRPDAKFIQADGEALPFEPNSFDAILCVRFLNLVPSEPRRKILAEFKRVSKRWLIIASGYFRKHDFLLPVLAPVVPGFAKRLNENRELHEDLRVTGWRESLWVPYKSRGVFSTTKMIGVFEK
jgi:SAM-dependent methyltransferase